MQRFVLPVLLVACGSSPPPDVLVFSRTNGFRHGDAIDACAATLPARLDAIGLTSRVTEDPGAFDDLTGVRAVFFAYTTGNDILDADGKVEFERFVRAGGGWAGVHSATDTEYEWPFYQEVIVAHFLNHPAIQPAVVDIVDRTHPATAVLPDGRWPGTDEWYNFATNPRGEGVQILATIDETTYAGGAMGADHPMIWAHERLGGRVFYSELGHVAERWQEPAYVDHVVAGIGWVARITDGAP